MRCHRGSHGTWYIRSTSPFAVVWGGVAGDVPVPGDYNGDGNADVAICRPSTGVWSVNGQFATAFGQSGDVPLPLPDGIRRVFFGAL